MNLLPPTTARNSGARGQPVGGLGYPKLIHYNSFPKGTHFAAWEQTDLFVSEMRASFKSLRG